MVPYINHTQPQYNSNEQAMTELFKIINGLSDALKTGNLGMFNNLLGSISNYGIDVRPLMGQTPQNIIIALTDMYNQAANSINTQVQQQVPMYNQPMGNPGFHVQTPNRYVSNPSPYMHNNIGLPNNDFSCFTNVEQGTPAATQPTNTNLGSKVFSKRINGTNTVEQTTVTNTPPPVQEPIVDNTPKAIRDVRSAIFCKGIEMAPDDTGKPVPIGIQDPLYTKLPEPEDGIEITASSIETLTSGIEASKLDTLTGLIYTHTDTVLTGKRVIDTDIEAVTNVIDSLYESKDFSNLYTPLQTLLSNLSGSRYINVIYNFISRYLEVEIDNFKIDNNIEEESSKLLLVSNTIKDMLTKQQRPKELAELEELLEKALEVFKSNVEISVVSNRLQIKLSTKAMYLNNVNVIEDIDGLNGYYKILNYTHPWLYKVIKDNNLRLLTYMDKYGLEKSIYICPVVIGNNLRFIVNAR